MSYDGSIQFDIAMDTAQFQQGLEQIIALLQSPGLEAAVQGASGEVCGVFANMAEQAVGISAAMPPAMQEALLAGAPLIVGAAKDTAEGVSAAFATLPQATAGIMPQVFAGMSHQMDALAPGLYQKASGIADGILRQLRRAFDIRSPSKKTQEIAANLMQGLVLGLQGGEEQTYAKADAIALEMLARLNRGEDAMPAPMHSQLQQAVLQNRQFAFSSGGAAPQAPIATGGGGNRVNLGGLTQNFYAPKAPSPAEATQMGMAFLEQARWKLAQIVTSN